jgi:hypothetical protein
MPSDDIEEVLRWLDPRGRPVLVQLPEPVYRVVREAWGLPDDGAGSGSSK